MQRCERTRHSSQLTWHLSADLSTMMQPNFTGAGMCPTARSGPRMTQRVRRHRGKLLVEPRPGVEPLERANRRRDDAIFQKKKKGVGTPHSRDLSAIPCTSCRTVFTQYGRRLIALCRFPKNCIEGGVVITSLRIAENSAITRGISRRFYSGGVSVSCGEHI